jgi:hypothetical protein
MLQSISAGFLFLFNEKANQAPKETKNTRTEDWKGNRAKFSRLPPETYILDSRQLQCLRHLISGPLLDLRASLKKKKKERKENMSLI